MTTETVKLINPKSSFTIMQRLRNLTGAYLQQSDVSSIAWACYREGASGQVASGTLVVASVIFDTLQTDAKWSLDATGYNFKHDVAHTVCTRGNSVYRFEYEFVYAGGSEDRLDPSFVRTRENRMP